MSMTDTETALEQRALDCERKANLTKDEDQRQSFLHLARQWRDLAADYEELCEKGADTNNPPPAHTGDEATRWFADDLLPEWREP